MLAFCRTKDTDREREREREIRRAEEKRQLEKFLLPYGQAVARGTEMRMRRAVKRSVSSAPRLRVPCLGNVGVSRCVCPDFSPRPAESMLHSGSLFTF